MSEEQSLYPPLDSHTTTDPNFSTFQDNRFLIQIQLSCILCSFLLCPALKSDKIDWRPLSSEWVTHACSVVGAEGRGGTSKQAQALKIHKIQKSV